MDLNKYVESLVKQEKIELIELLINDFEKKEKIKALLKEEQILYERQKGLIEVPHFLQNVPLPTRIRNALKKEHYENPEFNFINEMTRKHFLLLYGIGERSWYEFLDVINTKLKNSVYSSKEKELRHYFNEQERNYKENLKPLQMYQSPRRR